jgi:N-carbamoyl-L-amino-acid hydrolase
MAAAMAGADMDVNAVGRDEEALSRIGTFVELHIEQGRFLIDRDESVAVGSAIWPHGRWRLDLKGQANHAGTTRLSDRRDPTLDLARLITAAREQAESRDCVATVGKVRIVPNAVNAIPSTVTAWLDARGPEESTLRDLVAAAAAHHVAVEESFSAETSFDADLSTRIADCLGGAPLIATGAGHDAGVLARAGIPSTMLFVRNPTGISHSPEEFAERDDCLAGVRALVTVLEELAG